ncbi:hypothetical protein IFM89_007197 [Coptis chinensis]|uniref:Pentatricopeptide repeat-containing protein n=1 Tax=Coptis chinensis TaxID=261450 RepID=A0A835HBA6_9MAGN|nr:hypothetical protein IFM89_007197 [Coptis chinensis]
MMDPMEPLMRPRGFAETALSPLKMRPLRRCRCYHGKWKDRTVYGVQRELKHYGCMADLLGRAGLIKEAMEMIERMPMKADVFVWGGLLGGCRIHGNVEVAEIAAKRLMELDPEDGGVYTVMANIYATERRWEDVAKMRKLMNGRKIGMNNACSSIQINGITHEFIAGDTSVPKAMKSIEF